MGHIWILKYASLKAFFRGSISSVFTASEGGTIGTVVDVRLLITVALKTNACKCIIAAHNHPSANLQPSNADVKITEKLKNAASLLEIILLDHIILSTESYFSFADEGLL